MTTHIIISDATDAQGGYPWATPAQLRATEGRIEAMLAQVLAAIGDTSQSLRSAVASVSLIDPVPHRPLSRGITMTLEQEIAALTTSVQGATTRVQTDVANLKAQIAALQAQPTVTQADLDAITALQAQVDAIDPTTTTTLATAAAKPVGGAALGPRK